MAPGEHIGERAQEQHPQQQRICIPTHQKWPVRAATHMQERQDNDHPNARSIAPWSDVFAAFPNLDHSRVFL
jgi:hypothetical protein